MQTERLNRLRACTGGCGVSTRMAERIFSSQSRAMLCAARATNGTPAEKASATASQRNLILAAGTEAVLPSNVFIIASPQIAGARLRFVTPFCLVTFIDSWYYSTSSPESERPDGGVPRLVASFRDDCLRTGQSSVFNP